MLQVSIGKKHEDASPLLKVHLDFAPAAAQVNKKLSFISTYNNIHNIL